MKKNSKRTNSTVKLIVLGVAALMLTTFIGLRVRHEHSLPQNTEYRSLKQTQDGKTFPKQPRTGPGFNPNKANVEMPDAQARRTYSQPVKVDANSPAGTIFTAEGVAQPDFPRQNPNDPVGVAPGVPIAYPGQQSVDAYRSHLHRLKLHSERLAVASVQKRQDLGRRAAAFGIPLQVDAGGTTHALESISETGEAIYLGNMNLSAADTSAIDQLWPTNATGVWNDPGNSNYSLTGEGEVIGMWEVAASVRDTHEQLSGRVFQLDAALSPQGNHATAVAGSLASSGLPAPFTGGSLNPGTWSRGIAYSSIIHAYDIAEIISELADEQSQGLKFANHSFGTTSGWLNGGTPSAPVWRWFGFGSHLEDWTFGAYNSGTISDLTARSIDQNTVQAPFSTLVYSAGNDQNQGPGAAISNYLLGAGSITSSLPRDWTDGDDGGYDSVPATGCAKNIITVGSIRSLEGGWTSASSVFQSPFSSTGPTDDGRIKPEIVAQGSRTSTVTPRNPLGTQIITTGLEPAAPDDGTYSIQDGTSFSAPVVTGSIALINQRRVFNRSSYQDYVDPSGTVFDLDWSEHPMRSSSVRALLVHTTDEAGTALGPDYRMGYGVLNAQRAATHVNDDQLAGSDPQWNGAKPFFKEALLPQANSIRFNISRVNSSTPLKVTIAWLDPAGIGQTANTFDQQTARLVNDLDLRVYPPGIIPGSTSKNASTTSRPWILNPDLTNKTAAVRGSAATRGDDTRNNLEQVVVDNPAAGNYTVVIDHKGTLNGQMQWVSIMVSGITVVNPAFYQQTVSNNGNGTFTITWPSVVGATYVVEGSPDLINWAPATGDLSAIRETTSYVGQSPNGETTYFWRVGRTY